MPMFVCATLLSALMLGRVAGSVASPPTTLTWSNVKPRYNKTGDIMDAHDGSYNQWGGPGNPWYYYAMGYGTCQQGGDMCSGCGYGYSWIGVWKSDDMTDGSWELVGEARADDGTWPDASSIRAYFRVHTVYNAKTKKYVLWANTASCPNDKCYTVGTSDSPEGPFTFVGMTGTRLPQGGDFDILVDDDEDATGYIIYTSVSTGHSMSIEMLNENYTKTLADTPAPAPSPEPPIPGYSLVGEGGCRDSTEIEPPFFTNEEDPTLKASMVGNETACAAQCTKDSACTAFSWCNGENAGKSDNGACHLYVPDSSVAPTEQGWVFKNSGGNATDIKKVHADETWWRCQAKTHTENRHGQPPLALGFRSDPGPSNTSSGLFGNRFVEAPAIFKRGQIYYALFGECCCFCGHGSGIGVYTAPKPLGPWSYHENVGCAHDGTNFEPKPGCGCGMNGGSPKDLQCPAEYGSSVTKAQQNFVIEVNTPSGKEYIWTGDMWQSATDGIKAHDLQFWAPLEFVEAGNAGIPVPKPVRWIDNFTIQIL